MPRFRSFHFWALTFGILILLAGCARNNDFSPTTEKDDPAYQRGKSLEQQGRDQEALSAFLKIIARRGEDAPESHLEAALLYQEHVKDPISAIYYYKKYLDLCPNSPKADLVRQQISACTRDFARGLPGQPLGNVITQPDFTDVVDRLQKENDALKSQVAELRAALAARPAPASGQQYGQSAQPSGAASRAPSSTVAEAPQPVITRAPLPTERPERPQIAPVPRPSLTVKPATPGHVHTVAKGDTLMNISQHYYGTRTKWRDIYAANRDVMKSENDLKIGMQLKIP